jgi:predicted RNase H-like nuclease
MLSAAPILTPVTLSQHFNMPTNDVWLAGVDGCRAGWLVALTRPQANAVRLRVIARFAEIMTLPESPAVIAVDIPIGLPERVGRGGRAAESAVRPLLGARQSSLFSVPARAALAKDDYREACAIALSTSDPPRKISRQLFMLAAKIREVDACLRREPSAVARVYEVHPELAFWRLNGNQALHEPKKVKGCSYPPGLALRRRLLVANGMPLAAVNGNAPAGAAPDDVLDALACATIAQRIHMDQAQPFPDPPERDAFGLPMAIWA